MISTIQVSEKNVKCKKMLTVSILFQRIVFSVISLAMFIITFALCSYMYMSIGSQTWQLISSIQLRTIIMINAIVSSMVFILGFVSIMKFQKTWQIVYCFFLSIPLILCFVQLSFIISYEGSATMLFKVINNSVGFESDKIKIISELNELTKDPVSCGECNYTNFMCCVSYAERNSDAFIPKLKNCTIGLLCSFFITLGVNAVFLLFCKIEENAYSPAA